MKKLLGVDIDGSATLTPGAANIGTVTLSGRSFALNQILVITNVTRNTILYNFADPTSGAFAYTNNVLTLDVNTSTFSASDELQVFVDVSDPQAVVANRSDDLLRMMSRIVKLLESNAVVDAAQRQRVAVEALPTLAAVTTVSTVTSMTNAVSIAGMDREQYINIAKNTYANSIRSKLEFV